MDTVYLRKELVRSLTGLAGLVKAGKPLEPLREEINYAVHNYRLLVKEEGKRKQA